MNKNSVEGPHLEVCRRLDLCKKLGVKESNFRRILNALNYPEISIIGEEVRKHFDALWDPPAEYPGSSVGRRPINLDDWVDENHKDWVNEKRSHEEQPDLQQTDGSPAKSE
jgi:hypothetical protein